MNSEIIVATERDTLAGTLSFPEVASRLIAGGVEYYHVDYVGLRKTFYSADGHVVVTPISYEGLPPITADFSAQALRAAILDSQRHVRSTVTSRGARWRQVSRDILPFCAASESLIGGEMVTSIRNGFLEPSRQRHRRE